MEYDVSKALKRMEQRRFFVRELKREDGTFEEIGLPEPKIENKKEKKSAKQQKSRELLS